MTTNNDILAEMKKNCQVTCHDINGNLFEISVDQLSFRPSVYGVIIKDGKVLLSKQWDGYDFPGGAIEPGETIHEALIREIFMVLIYKNNTKFAKVCQLSITVW